ncbi:MAG: hypothetical protein ACRDHL_15810, partial [Candidatus Promineifilaceae bacterium]
MGAHLAAMGAAACGSHGRRWLALSLLGSLLLTFVAQGDRLADPFAINEDFRRFHWYQRIYDPELFPDDGLIYSKIQTYQLGSQTLVVDHTSPLYSIFIWLGSFFANPTFVAKWLAFPLTAALAGSVFGVLRSTYGPRSGALVALATTVFVLGSTSSTSTLTGLQRAFMWPLILGEVAMLTSRRFGAAALVVLLSGLIYPPAFVLGAATYGLSLASHFFRDRRPWPEVWRPAFYLLAAVLLVALAQLPTLRGQVRVAQNNAEVVQTEEVGFVEREHFQDGGRYDLFELFPLSGRGGLVTDAFQFLQLLVLC